MISSNIPDEEFALIPQDLCGHEKISPPIIFSCFCCVRFIAAIIAIRKRLLSVSVVLKQTFVGEVFVTTCVTEDKCSFQDSL